jgi:hypothetical protein
LDDYYIPVLEGPTEPPPFPDLVDFEFSINIEMFADYGRLPPFYEKIWNYA